MNRCCTFYNIARPGWLRPLSDTCRLSSSTQYLTRQADTKTESVHLKQADLLLVIKRENVNSCWCYFVSVVSYKSSTVMERKV